MVGKPKDGDIMTKYYLLAKHLIHREMRLDRGDVLILSDDDFELISEKQFQNLNTTSLMYIDPAIRTDWTRRPWHSMG